MLSQIIINNWETTAKDFVAEIKELFENGYPAWAVRIGKNYGVAIPLPEDMEVLEKFSGASLESSQITLADSKKIDVLILSTRLENIKVPFASLCSEFITPGNNGELRAEISSNPVSWWMQWKELLGNKNVDERVYDALGELCVLKYLANKHIQAEWNGPNAATYDIDSDSAFYEVKSSTARNKRQITLSNHFQLEPPNGKELFLILCQFEQAQSGLTINSLVEELYQLGYSKQDLNDKLELLGLERRQYSRNRSYILHAMTKYKVDASFPAIRESSFVGGLLPKCVETINYTLSLDGVDGEKIYP